jgi:S-DNA-T family DNA segregation ATPase FtsK/SpoIIIE
LFPIVSDTDEMIERLGYLVSEMEHRDRELITRPRIVIVVDELADVIETGGAAMESALTRLVQRGRSAGVSLIACTQKPTARAVGTLMKANFPVRLVGRVASAEDARVAAGIGGTGAEKLAGRGDFLLVAGGQIIRFQVAQSKLNELELSTNERPGIFGRLRRVK